LDALQKAQAADRAKTMFLASMSHEIRTPLNAVIGFAELLKDEKLSSEMQKDYLACISSAGNSLLMLINDVLDLSRLEADQMVFTPVEVDISELVRDVGAIFRQKCEERNLRFVSDIRKDLPHVWVDRLRIRQILFNLIGNAVKFTKEGSVTVAVRFYRETKDTGTLKFSVIDTGMGISSEDRQRLFNPFVQSDAIRGTQVAGSGSGLGLSIVRRMVEKMRGTIELDSEPGKGSDFTVTLHGITFQSRPPRTDKVEKVEPSEEISTVDGTVLLVDDVLMNLKVLSAMLDRLSVKVYIAQSAEAAWRELERHPVDFILTDLWMPGENGVELARRISADERFRSVKIAAVTADIENEEKFDMSIFDSVLIKPITMAKLREFLQSGKSRDCSGNSPEKT
ncbi:MAG: ATP-binding protein, partial [Planctomycetia bacterium]|nr:ATP-binding protein [Planctomycetia bacterium]